MNEYGLTQKEEDEITAMFEKYPEIDEVILFGSRAMNTFTKTSDIDFTVKGEKISKIIGALISDFEDSSLIYEVDIISYQTISSDALLEHIRKRGKLFYRKGWVETTLGEVVELVGGGTPKTATSKYWNGDIPWLSVIDFNNSDRWVSKTEKSITEEGLQNSSAKLLDEGDLIISARGTVGALAQLKKQMAFNQSCYGVKRIKDISNSDFLFYLIKYNVKQISKKTHGAVFDTITRQTFDNIQINLPPLLEQEAIAAVLSAFDNKMELLREQNRTLETFAQTIFKEWFVHFNFPDKDGKPYRDNGGEMVDSELGEIPKGWRVGRLSEIAEFINGLALQKYPPIDGEETLLVIKIRELNKGFTVQTDRANTKLDKKYIIHNGDIIFSWSGSLEVVIWKYGKGALNQHLFKVSSDNYPKWFYYYWTLFHLREFRVIASNKATTMGHIQRKHLDEAKVFLPDNELMNRETELFSSLIGKLILNNAQIQTLSKTRDTLLPKLMNGEIRVNVSEV